MQFPAIYWARQRCAMPPTRFEDVVSALLATGRMALHELDRISAHDRLVSGASMDSLISHSQAETESIGERWGRIAKRGWIIALTGELGAGKTQWVKGFARGLDIRTRVHSPTFAIVNEYLDGRLPLFHLDLYRLETSGQIQSAGLEEFLKPDGVTVIEWAERWPEILNMRSRALTPGTLLRVEIEISGETERRIRYDDFGD